MSLDYKACRETASGNIILPRARMVYPSLFRPNLMKGETDESKAKYQISLLMPGDVNLDPVKLRVKTLLDENLTAAQQNGKIKKPFIKTEETKLADMSEDFPLTLRLNATLQNKPQVIDASAQNVDDESEVYSGRWCFVSCRPFFYDHPQGGKGISLGLQNVQLLEHDEAIAGGRARAEDEFVPVDAPAGAGDTAAAVDSLFD